MGKGKGWDNEEHKKNSKKQGEAYRQTENVKQFQRQPYDPAKEKVTATVGKVQLSRGSDEIYLVIERSSYDGGPEGVVVRKKLRDGRFVGLGKLWPDQVNELMALLNQAVKDLGVKEAADRAAREAAKQQAKDQELIQRVVGR
jgi:hypothetical protein